mmetsp:Transcript_585/g.1201  ORF Transcript_585/g.1201 Transcript_585/m.1201 type:complete len:181 (-) Transcript_585:5-547(-)
MAHSSFHRLCDTEFGFRSLSAEIRNSGFQRAQVLEATVVCCLILAGATVVVVSGVDTQRCAADLDRSTRIFGCAMLVFAACAAGLCYRSFLRRRKVRLLELYRHQERFEEADSLPAVVPWRGGDQCQECVLCSSFFFTLVFGFLACFQSLQHPSCGAVPPVVLVVCLALSCGFWLFMKLA